MIFVNTNRIILHFVRLLLLAVATSCMLFYRFHKHDSLSVCSTMRLCDRAAVPKLRTKTGATVVKTNIKTKYPITEALPFRIENKHICKTDKNISCVVIVHTSPAHTEARNVMRQTFLNLEAYEPNIIRVVFLLGITQDPVIQHRIEEENIKNRDIVQGNFIDSYHNLTYKGVMGLNWLTKYCQNAELVLKIDDDIFINFPKVFSDLAPLRYKNNAIACSINPINALLIQRGTNDPWRVDKYEFKDMLTFPVTYCSGAAVFMTPDLIPKLTHAALFTPFFWIDDVYLFGLLTSKLNGTVVFEGLGSQLTINNKKTADCFLTKGKLCHLIVGAYHRNDLNTSLAIWDSIHTK